MLAPLDRQNFNAARGRAGSGSFSQCDPLALCCKAMQVCAHVCSVLCYVGACQVLANAMNDQNERVHVM